MGELIGASEASSRLRVSVSTLYAYVSRGALRRVPGPDGRSSLYDTDEIAALAARSRPRTKRRAPSSIDLLVSTKISTVIDGVVRYRNIELANLIEQQHSFETIAELLWETPRMLAALDWPLPPVQPRATADPIDASTIVPHLVEAVIQTQQAMTDPDVIEWTAAGQHAVNAMLSVSSSMHGDHRHETGGGLSIKGPYRVATRMWQQWSPLKPTAARVRVMNTALVLLAEHELALSTISARVAASARARPHMCVIAGLSALDGTLHGRASTTLHSHLLTASEHQSATRADQVGSGHVIHRTDPRTAILLDAVWSIASAVDRRRIESIVRDTGPSANVDLALAALAYVARMPVGSTTAIFAVARSAGWIAHAREEYGEQPLRFRGHAIQTGTRTP